MLCNSEVTRATGTDIRALYTVLAGARYINRYFLRKFIYFYCCFFFVFYRALSPKRIIATITFGKAENGEIRAENRINFVSQSHYCVLRVTAGVRARVSCTENIVGEKETPRER